MEPLFLEQLKTEYKQCVPDASFIAKSKGFILSMPKQAQVQLPRRATLWESFLLGSALTLAGILVAVVFVGKGTGGPIQTASVGGFDIKIGEVNYDIREAANVALGKLENDLRSTYADEATRNEILQKLEEVKEILN